MPNETRAQGESEARAHSVMLHARRIFASAGHSIHEFGDRADPRYREAVHRAAVHLEREARREGRSTHKNSTVSNLKSFFNVHGGFSSPAMYGDDYERHSPLGLGPEGSGSSRDERRHRMLAQSGNGDDMAQRSKRERTMTQARASRSTHSMRGMDAPLRIQQNERIDAPAQQGVRYGAHGQVTSTSMSRAKAKVGRMNAAARNATRLQQIADDTRRAAAGHGPGALLARQALPAHEEAARQAAARRDGVGSRRSSVAGRTETLQNSSDARVSQAADDASHRAQRSGSRDDHMGAAAMHRAAVSRAVSPAERSRHEARAAHHESMVAQIRQRIAGEFSQPQGNPSTRERVHMSMDYAANARRGQFGRTPAGQAYVDHVENFNAQRSPDFHSRAATLARAAGMTARAELHEADHQRVNAPRPVNVTPAIPQSDRARSPEVASRSQHEQQARAHAENQSGRSAHDAQSSADTKSAYHAAREQALSVSRTTEHGKRHAQSGHQKAARLHMHAAEVARQTGHHEEAKRHEAIAHAHKSREHHAHLRGMLSGAPTGPTGGGTATGGGTPAPHHAPRPSGPAGQAGTGKRGGVFVQVGGKKLYGKARDAYLRRQGGG